MFYLSREIKDFLGKNIHSSVNFRLLIMCVNIKVLHSYGGLRMRRLRQMTYVIEIRQEEGVACHFWDSLEILSTMFKTICGMVWIGNCISFSRDQRL